jgi:FtsP/CotA-like multicopper oxidase with cupredoxin domain
VAASAVLTTAGGLALLSGAPARASAAKKRASAAKKPPRGGVLWEYWIQADAFLHNLVPTGRDGMMGRSFAPQQSSYWALGYRAYTPGWGQPLAGNDTLGPNTGIPGPVLHATVGDTIRVHFRNNDWHYRFPHSIHPHGVVYTPESDGAWTALEPYKPGTAINFGESYTYEYTVAPSSVGTWPYHDHSAPQALGPGGPVMELGAELGLFGILAITDAQTPPVDLEVCLFMHDVYQVDIPVLAQDFDCFNGCAFLGNTPTITAQVGQRVRWRVAALGKEFHAFHLHGHRWLFNGRYDDTLVLGPATTVTFDYVEDNPGSWLYHCHVTDHMMGGMVGCYVVEA